VLRDLRLAAGESESDSFTVSYWKTEPGDCVGEGDEVLVVESVEEKTALAVLSPWAGVLAEIVAGEGSAVGPGALLGRIETG
jgi:2-oxoglutarate dehydrogenase E2 component (dihydrolipoamide succinyltransferase)